MPGTDTDSSPDGALLRQLAYDVCSLAQRGGMPDTYWLTDSRIVRACAVLDISPAEARSRDWSAPGFEAMTDPRPADSPIDSLDAGAPTHALEVWTDGACSGNPGPGGWGWTTNEPDPRSGWGWDPSTTNNRMEIQAVIEALTTVPERPVVVVTDSRYVVDCFHKAWWKGWVKRGWKNSQGAPVSNQDLWETLIRLVFENEVTFRWVKGHGGHALNEAADALAVRGRNHASRVIRDSR